MRGDGRVFKRKHIWWVAYYRDGQEHRESSRSRERKEAVRLLRRRVGETAAGVVKHVPASKRAITRSVTMLELFDLVEDNYHLNNRTSPANRVYLRRLRKRFAGYTAQACTSIAITHYMTDMQREGRKPETINREIAILRFALGLGRRHELIESVPSIKLLPQLAVRNEFFTQEEIDALIPRLPDYLRDATLFAYLTGWRKGEISGLQWSNVNRSAGFIRLKPKQDKARMVRVLPLEGQVTALIERRWHARKEGFQLIEHVFHRSGRKLGNFREAWLTACRKAGLGHRMFHSLRRSAARNMSLQGIPEKVIMSIMGHNTRVMFDRYNIVTEADQRVYAKRLFGP